MSLQREYDSYAEKLRPKDDGTVNYYTRCLVRDRIYVSMLDAAIEQMHTGRQRRYEHIVAIVTPICARVLGEIIADYAVDYTFRSIASWSSPLLIDDNTLSFRDLNMLEYNLGESTPENIRAKMHYDSRAFTGREKLLLLVCVCRGYVPRLCGHHAWFTCTCLRKVPIDDTSDIAIDACCAALQNADVRKVLALMQEQK